MKLFDLFMLNWGPLLPYQLCQNHNFPVVSFSFFPDREVLNFSVALYYGTEELENCELGSHVQSKV